MDVLAAEQLFAEAENMGNLGGKDDALLAYRSLVSACEETLRTCTDDQQKSKILQLLGLAYNNMGYIKYKKVDFDEAIEDYTQAVTYSADLAVAYFNRGIIHYRLGRYEEAVRDQEKALSLQPDLDAARKCHQQAMHDRVEHR